MVRKLLTLKANPNKHCELGNTALHQALMIGERIETNLQICVELISAGANPRLQNNFGMTPIFFASYNFI